MQPTVQQQLQHQQQQQQQYMQTQPRSLEIASGNNNFEDNKNIRTENSRLKQLVMVFSCVAVLAVAGLAAGITVAVLQTNKATAATSGGTTGTAPPQKPITIIYVFNDDEEDEPLLSNSDFIVDPVIDTTTDNEIPSDSGANSGESFVITAEDLAEEENDPLTALIPINDRIPVNDSLP